MSESARPANGAWKPWRMDELARPPRPAPNGGEAPQRFRQQAELEELRENARRQARREGYEAGFAEGREQGYHDGLEQGRETGRKELDAERDALLAHMNALLQGMQQALEQAETDIGDALVDVALATGLRLAGEAIEKRPEQILERVHELLREEPLFGGRPRLWLHPEDLALVESRLADELAAAGWKAVPDASMQRGGCRLTGSEGELDATRETRWQALLAHARRTRGHGAKGAEAGATP